MHWQLRTQILQLDKPVFMGIVNVTPDSFSDGGHFFTTDNAVRHALELVRSGAGILDLGGESTRPGSSGVSADEELQRLLPVIEHLRRLKVSVPISVDTAKADVAQKVIRYGAEIINDVSGLADPAMIDVLRRSGAGYCLTHTQGIPKTMQDNPHYKDVTQEVLAFLRERRSGLIASGIMPQRIAVDPGLGFGKTAEHNWQLVEEMDKFLALDSPLLVGHSRKRFLAARFADRDEGTHFVTKILLEKGVHIVRVHCLEQRTSGEC
ncbi:MAG: dihydropteroate synthase [Planctomycetaceae bacterium]|jgi:dihydropteroate synthase|nr:dihydropteroate synthase [Planctomycetaceae bacterium]